MTSIPTPRSSSTMIKRLRLCRSLCDQAMLQIEPAVASSILELLVQTVRSIQAEIAANSRPTLPLPLMEPPGQFKARGDPPAGGGT